MKEEDSFYVHARVCANFKKESFLEEKKGYFRISVKEKAQMNAANKRVVELLREHFGAKRVSIVNGHQSPSKLLKIDL